MQHVLILLLLAGMAVQAGAQSSAPVHPAEAAASRKVARKSPAKAAAKTAAARPATPPAQEPYLAVYPTTMNCPSVGHAIGASVRPFLIDRHVKFVFCKADKFLADSFLEEEFGFGAKKLWVVANDAAFHAVPQSGPGTIALIDPAAGKDSIRYKVSLERAAYPEQEFLFEANLHPVLQSVRNIGFPPSGDVSLMLGPHIVACNDYHRQKFAVLDRQTGTNITPVFPVMDSIFALNLVAARRITAHNSQDFLLGPAMFGEHKETVAQSGDTLHIFFGIDHVKGYTPAEREAELAEMHKRPGHENEQLADSATIGEVQCYVVRWAPGQPSQWAALHTLQPYVDSLGVDWCSFLPLSGNQYAFDRNIDTSATDGFAFLNATQVDWATHANGPYHGTNHRLPARTPLRGRHPNAWGHYLNGALLLEDPALYYPDGNFSGIGPIALPDSYAPYTLRAITPYKGGHLGVYWGKNETTLHVALFSPDCTTRLAATTLPERPDQRTDDALQPVAAAIDAGNVAVLWNDGQVYVYSLHDAPKPASPGKKRKGASDKHS